MMTSSYILPDVYKSSYGMEIDVEIKSEPESDEDLFDSITASETNLNDNDLNSQHCQNDDDLKESEEETLVEIDSITVSQDLVEDELEPTLLLYVNKESPKCKLSQKNPPLSNTDSDITTTNKTPLDKPPEIVNAERNAVTKALRSIKKKSYPLVNKTNLKQEGLQIECEMTTNDSDHFSNNFQSPCISSETTNKVANLLLGKKNGKSRNIIKKSVNVLSNTEQINGKQIKTSLKHKQVSEEHPYLITSSYHKRKTKSAYVRKSRKGKKDRCNPEKTLKNLIKKDILSHAVNDKTEIVTIGASNEESDHMKTNLKPISFDCTICGKQFKEKSHLATHSRAHVDIRNFKCNECGNSFKTKTNLLFHMKTHEEAPFICKHCDKTFLERKILMRHIRVVHSGEGKYNCDQCGRSFKSAQNLELHYTLHTGNKPYSCNVCGKSFVYKMTYMTHMRAHAADNAFSCELCPDAASKGELRRRCHHFSEARPWLCTVCGKGYPLKSTLKSHMKTHEPEKAFKCNECGKSFVKKQAYESHIKTHKGENPQFMCDQCSQSYFNVFALKRHYMKHTSERKFICDICSKAFWTKDALKVHKRSHVSVKMFHCTQCSKSFAHKHTLVAHSKSHNNDQSFSCGACPKTFIHKYNLDRHERQHTMTPMSPLPSLPALPPSLIMMAPPKHLDFSTLHIL